MFFFLSLSIIICHLSVVFHPLSSLFSLSRFLLLFFLHSFSLSFHTHFCLRPPHRHPSFRSLSSSLIPLPYYPPFRPPPHHYHSHIHHSSSSSSSYSSSSYSSPDRRRKYIIREICKFQVLHINGAKTVISSLIGSAEFQKYFHIGFSVQM